MATPNRPGRRPAVSGPPSKGTGIAKRQGQSIEELRSLPDFVDEGDPINLDPANASEGGFGGGEGTRCTISAAKFGKFQYITKEGTVLDYAPELRLFLEFDREGYDQPRRESLKYANFGMFAPTKDGNSVKPRPQALEGRKTPPAPYKYNEGVLFLQSLKDAGFSAEKLNKDGISAIVGLEVVVRRRRVAGQGENAKAALLVDYIEGKTEGKAASTAAGPSPKSSGESVKAAAAAADGSVNAELEVLTETAVLDILDAQESGNIARNQIPTALIRLDQWSRHEQRGSILGLLRKDDFLNDSSRPWAFDGKTVTRK